MAKRDLKSIVDQIIDLPTLPQVVSAIIELLDDPNSSVNDINDVMSKDPALVAKILKVVNSAFYSLPNPVSSISQAIVILGFNTVKSIAISASVLDMFGSGDECFSYEEFWAHSIGCATVASSVSRRIPGADADTAFVLGLVHDLGKLILDQYAPVEFQDILSMAQSRECQFCEVEQEELETTHADIGYWLAQKWKLDENLALAIKYHHTIAESDTEWVRLHASICSFANYVCKQRSYGSSGCFGKPKLDRDAWDALKLDKEDLPRLVETINDEMTRADDFLSVVNS
ncbi:MAG: HDOD domain-containing protein [Planctomycetota bacterium]|jgi:HD-like signal output (HDOD) protein